MIGVENLTVAADDFRLEKLTLTIPTGQYGVMQGASGSGKTTLLETLCGLRPALTGVVRLGNVDVTRIAAAHRGIGYVPQDGALFTRMTVRQNVDFALKVRGATGAERDERVAELAEQLGIVSLLDQRAGELSGGQSRRVALGRALAAEPPVLLLDEPLTGLDEATQEDMILLLRQVVSRSGCTALHVTHSRREAQALADTLLEIAGGKIVVCHGVGAPSPS